LQVIALPNLGKTLKVQGMNLIANASQRPAKAQMRQYRQSSDSNGRPDVDPTILVPIRSLGASYRGQIAHHLLELDDHDRYLRFGFVGADEHIERYVAGLDFERDVFLGITNRKLELIAIAHLAMISANGKSTCAEFGVSVRKTSRGRGFGALLFERAAMDARNKGVSSMFIHALSENAAMLRIARNAGAVIERDGPDAEAYLRLAPASLGSRMAEIVEDHYAQIDYRLKTQSKQLHDMFAAFKSLNRSWRGTKREPGA
jgi:GNAT superfamily N-acetyltransferase